jgi:hypothetical protein
MRRRALIVISFLLIALAALIVVLAPVRPAAPLPVTVSFMGYTNDGNAGHLAMFAVTNHSDATIFRWGHYHPEAQRQPGLLAMLYIDPNKTGLAMPKVFLAPGQSEVIEVPPPTNQGVWRVVLDCGRDGWRRKLEDWWAPGGLGQGGLINAIVPDRLKGVPTQQIRSDWID